MSLLDGATLRGSGESAFVVEFGDTIDPEAGRRVGRLAAAFDALAPDGVVEIVPTFRSLLVEYDPDVTDEATLLAALPAADGPDAAAVPAAAWRVPVAMDGALAEDLAEAAEQLSLPPQRLAEIFLAGSYQLGMYGFAPGFAYLSGVDAALAIPRRASPRPPMAAGSVLIAGGMAALSPQPMPTGWYVIGRTPAPLFDPGRKPMVPFAVGDTIRFRRVDEAEFARLAAREDGGLAREAP